MAILYSGNGNPTSEQEQVIQFIFMLRPAWIRSAGQSLLYRYTVVLDITPTQTGATKYITSVVVNDFDVTNSTSTSLTPNGYDYVYDAYGHISGLSMWFEAPRALTTTALRQITPGGTYQRTITTVPYDKYDIALMGNKIFIVGDENIVLTPDELALRALDSITNVTISKSGGNVVVNFTPITDSNLLNLIDQGKTKIRVQLLEHAASFGVRYRGGDAEPRISDTNALSVTQLGYDIPTWANPGSSRPKQFFKRVRAWQPDYEGRAWLNLTSSQLRAGTATLTNVFDSTKGVSSSGALPSVGYAGHAGMTVFGETLADKEYGVNDVCRVAVELYVPALGPGTSDTFQYERDGHRKFSSNYVAFSRNL